LALLRHHQTSSIDTRIEESTPTPPARMTSFDPLKAGGVAEAGRIEMPGGDLHQAGLNGALLDLDEARVAVAAERSALPGTMG